MEQTKTIDEKENSSASFDEAYRQMLEDLTQTLKKKLKKDFELTYHPSGYGADGVTWDGHYVIKQWWWILFSKTVLTSDVPYEGTPYIPAFNVNIFDDSIAETVTSAVNEFKDHCLYVKGIRIRRLNKT